MPPTPAKFMATLKIQRIDSSVSREESVSTTVRATTLEKLTEKVNTILSTMEEGVDL